MSWSPPTIPCLALKKTARRIAGAGSLGRPRWVGIADWRGGPVVREAKALVLSAWVREHGKGKGKIRCAEIANGRHRATDPWHHIADTIAVRRLSPNNRKIEADDDLAHLLSPDMLLAMGADLAGVHLGTATNGAAIARDLSRRKRGWLKIDATKMAKAVEADHAAWVAAKTSTAA